MLRGTLTLLTRSMRLDARLRRAHAFRILSIGVMFWLLVAAHVNSAGVSSPGLHFFRLICLLCFGLISVAGAGLFSSAITEEKEAGTLGLLLLAGISPLAIVVGKSTTRLVSSLVLFAGIFPFALLALALGGLTTHQIWSGFLALAAYLVFVANLGVLSSVTQPTTNRASMLTTLALLLLFAIPLSGPPLQATLMASGWIAPGGSASTWLTSAVNACAAFSPVHRLLEILETGFEESSWSNQVWANLLAGLICFNAAWGLFTWYCIKQFEDVPRRAASGRSSRHWWSQILMPRTWKAALVWKDFQLIGGGVPAMLLRFSVIPLALLVLSSNSVLLRIGLGLEPEAVFRLGLVLVAGLELVSISTRIVRSEYVGGTLCTLVMLPRSTAALCYGKLAGSLLILIPYALWMMVSYRLAPPPLLDEASRSQWYEGVVLLVCLMLVLTHLTAALSLIVKWGALPMSIILLMTLTSCATPFVSSAVSVSRALEGGGDSLSIPAVYLTLLVCAALQFVIGIRFRQAAAG